MTYTNCSLNFDCTLFYQPLNIVLMHKDCNNFQLIRNSLRLKLRHNKEGSTAPENCVITNNQIVPTTGIITHFCITAKCTHILGTRWLLTIRCMYTHLHNCLISAMQVLSKLLHTTYIKALEPMHIYGTYFTTIITVSYKELHKSIDHHGIVIW